MLKALITDNFKDERGAFFLKADSVAIPESCPLTSTSESQCKHMHITHTLNTCAILNRGTIVLSGELNHDRPITG